jgi:hypothetical protein
MRPATMWTAGVLLTMAVLLTACDGGEDVEPPDIASPTPVDTSPTPVRTSAGTPEPAPPTLDDEAAAELYVAWQETVYALPPTEPEAVDVDGAGDGVVVPRSEAAEWVAQELQLARERGVIVRGGVHAEATEPVQIAGDRATAVICASADVRVTDVATGDPVSDDAVDTSYTRVAVTYRRIGDDWLVERADPSDERDCVPASIEEAVGARWEQFTEAWYERDRQGGGEELGRLAQVVTDGFADTLRGLPERDPVPEPAPFTDFELIAVTRTSASGHACRSGSLQTVEWVLVDGQWRVDFAGREGAEATPCR